MTNTTISAAAEPRPDAAVARRLMLIVAAAALALLLMVQRLSAAYLNEGIAGLLIAMVGGISAVAWMPARATSA